MARERVNLNNVEASSTAMFSTLMSVVAMTFPCVMISENEAPPAVGGHRVLFRGNDLNRTRVVDHVLSCFNGFVLLCSELRHRA